MVKVNIFVGKIIEKQSMKMFLGEYVMGENKGHFNGGGSVGDEKDVRREGDRSAAEKQQREGRETRIIVVHY